MLVIPVFMKDLGSLADCKVYQKGIQVIHVRTGKAIRKGEKENGKMEMAHFHDTKADIVNSGI